MLAVSLPILLPFDAARNVDMQGALLIIAGGFAWGALLISHRGILTGLGRLQQVLLGVFLLCCLLSTLVNPHTGYDLWGAPYLRLGSAGLLACIGIGLLLRTVARRRLAAGLYLIILALAAVSPVYSYLHFHSLERMGGVFMQADVMACVAGCGWLLGLGMFEFYPRLRRALLPAQAGLAVVLLLTQTRAALVLAAGLSLLYVWRERRNQGVKRLLLYGAGTVLLAGSLYLFGPARLTNPAYASTSVGYRASLQHYALRAAWHKPWLGYGPGNLADALNCASLHAPALQATCGQGYFFNSSHNVFLDRVLGIGWLGGLAYLMFAVTSLGKGFRGRAKPRTMVYAALLIAGYYLTNVTSVTLELLFWILLINLPERA